MVEENCVKKVVLSIQGSNGVISFVGLVVNTNEKKDARTAFFLSVMADSLMFVLSFFLVNSQKSLCQAMLDIWTYGRSAKKQTQPLREK